MANVHCLKIKPLFFTAVSSGKKTFEIRFNDRHFRTGDILILREWCRGRYTGRRVVRQICYFCDWNIGLSTGYVALGLKPDGTLTEAQIDAAILLEDGLDEHEDGCE